MQHGGTFVSSAGLAGGLATGRIAASTCGGGSTFTGWACGMLVGSVAAQESGRIAGLAYDLGLEGFQGD